MSKVSGVKLSSFEEPIHEALRKYGELTDGFAQFDLDNAPILELTSDKPNSARSRTIVRLGEEVTADFFVIAFAPGDGTGDESVYRLGEVEVLRPYPQNATRVLPRAKTGVHTEYHMNLLTQKIQDVHADPEMFTGSYDLLGLLDKKQVGLIGEIGYPIEGRPQNPDPITTMTVGYGAEYNERFGDPHSVYSMDRSRVQVCGFLAVKEANPYVANTLRSLLSAQEPKIPTQVSTLAR